MEERRKAPRDRTFHHGVIAFNNRNSTADCFVRNCSGDGAKIAVAETLPLPREFDFLIPARRQDRGAAGLAAWRASGGEVRGLRKRRSRKRKTKLEATEGGFLIVCP